VEYYPQKEADKLGISYVPWRLAQKEGQWLLSDDGYVLKCTKVKTLVELQKGGKTPRVRSKIWTSLATRYPHCKAPMNIQEHIKARSYGLVPTPWFKDFDSRYPAIRSLLVKMVVTGKVRMSKNRRYNAKDYEGFIEIANKIFGNHKYLRWYQVRTFFGREEVREMIRQDIAAIAKKKGVTVDKVFELLNEAEQLGRGKKDGKVLLAVAKEYAGIIGLTQLMKPAGNDRSLPPHPDEELPGAEAAFDRIIEANS
jgi:hypothetical protein